MNETQAFFLVMGYVIGLIITGVMANNNKYSVWGFLFIGMAGSPLLSIGMIMVFRCLFGPGKLPSTQIGTGSG